MKRRSFLNLVANLSSYVLAPQLFNFIPVRSMARDEVPHFFVLIVVEGGMDVTLGLEPRIHQNGEDQNDVFLEYRPDEIVESNRIKLGPAASSLKDFAKDLIIVNGVNMRRDAGHPANREYLASGNGDGSKAFLPAEIGHATGHLGPAGIIQSNLSARLGKYELVTTDVAQFGYQISTARNDINFLDSTELNQSVGFEKAVLSYLEIAGPTKEIVKELSEENPSAQINSLPDEKLIAKIFQRKLSFQAVMDISRSSQVGLDTHSNHAGGEGVPGPHWKGQASIWSKVADIFKVFKNTKFNQSSLFDHTTFMVVTEFSRTPFLNNSKGKDHNPLTNSVLLTGPNFKGGQVVGGSRIIRRTDNKPATHIASPIDYSTGRIISVRENDLDMSKVKFIYPENLAQTIIHGFGNPAGINSVAKNIPVIPGVLK